MDMFFTQHPVALLLLACMHLLIFFVGSTPWEVHYIAVVFDVYGSGMYSVSYQQLEGATLHNTPHKLRFCTPITAHAFSCCCWCSFSRASTTATPFLFWCVVWGVHCLSTECLTILIDTTKYSRNITYLQIFDMDWLFELMKSYYV